MIELTVDYGISRHSAVTQNVVAIGACCQFRRPSVLDGFEDRGFFPDTLRSLGQDFRDFLMMKLSAPGARPEIVRYEVSGETVKTLVGAGLDVSITCNAYLDINYAGVVYREARDGNGAWRIGYSAPWAHDNANPTLKAFLKLLHERYPTPPDVE